jgi:DNA-binding LytR/AlgR family response regulator
MSQSAQHPIALIAEDEPLLAHSLQRELAQLWPQLRTELATDGLQAIDKALALLPQILFFDVRMPGCSGLEAAEEITERWPAGRSLPQLVFITAFDEYAVQAFERAAVDYIVKPVRTPRLQQTLQRIQSLAPVFIEEFATNNIANNTSVSSLSAAHDQALLDGLRQLIHPPAAQPVPRLQRIQASIGSSIAIVPMEEVIYFEAADKYVRVLTASRELLIRTPIKDLLPQLDPNVFWQIHRSTVVRASMIESVHRDEAGKLSLGLIARPEKLAVSRLYAGLFRAM